MEKEKFGKMKAAGYICLSFAAVLSILMLLPVMTVEPEIGLPLVYFWAGTGVTLLFGNAGKRIGGYAVMNNNPILNGGKL